jgi:putative FmdB family regulatory protein
MPLYSFICSKCYESKERILPMRDADKPQFCECGYQMRRNFQADIPHAPNTYKKPIHSDSLAINPEQRAEHEKIFPDIKLDSQCRPVFDNFQSHQRYLDKCNLVKERKKIRPKGKRIA